VRVIALAPTRRTGQSARVGVAQETYDEMVREGLRPRLKALGFAGSRTTFTWPSQSHFAQLGMQKSQYSNRDELRFTVNVTVAEKAAWEAARTVRTYLPSTPAPNTLYGDYIWQRRIGNSFQVAKTRGGPSRRATIGIPLQMPSSML
jgi:Domain of unknown function (DUF4304)